MSTILTQDKGKRSFVQRFFIIFSLLFTINLTQANEWDDASHTLAKPVEITVYRSPQCQCCHQWIEHLQTHNFNVVDKLVHNTQDVKQAVGLPKQLASCHTALVDGYIIEGHVPAGDIKRLLVQKPEIAGLSVPQMPVGTPGMEMGQRKEAFAVISFDKNGKLAIYNKYQTDINKTYQSASHSAQK